MAMSTINSLLHWLLFLLFLILLSFGPHLLLANHCTPSDCSGHGFCVGTVGGQPICFCELNFLGIRCEIELCSRLPGMCNGRGLCVGTSTVHVCLCQPGFSGPNCEQQGPSTALFRSPADQTVASRGLTNGGQTSPPVTCSPAQCHDRGICLALGNAGSLLGGQQPSSTICICQLRYNGLRCENDLFRKTVDLLQREGLWGNQTASGQGSIGAGAANGTALCSPADCSQQGICVGPKARPRCMCNLGFGGQRCQSALWTSMCSAKEHCSGRAICLGTAIWHTCACQPGWTGRRCEEPVSEKRLRMYWARFHHLPNGGAFRPIPIRRR